jgi:hypothetical protein
MPILGDHVPYKQTRLRVERVQADISYHAAYNYWNLRGLLAERWAHGPVFGAANDQPNQTTLTPAVGDDSDPRLWAVYGLRGSGLNAEGQHWVPQAPKHLDSWIADALAVLKPKRVVRASVSLVALYPVDDIHKTSENLRAAYYQADAVKDMFPESIRDYRDRFHSAVDFFAPFDDEGSGVSLILGALGPPHRGIFFAEADPERDDQWWLGMKYERRRVAAAGLHDAHATLVKMSRRSLSDLHDMADSALERVIE